MPAIFDYIIKLSVCIAVMYIFYHLFLRRLTFYNWNRWYLLGYSALSFIIPVIDIMPQLKKSEMDSNVVLQWIPVLGAPVVEKTFFETLSYRDWVLILIVAGIVVFLIRFLIKLFSFLLLRKQATLISSEQIRLYQLNENITPFTFGSAIYINRNLHSEAELQEIIRHEFIHVKQRHTIDIIWCELLCILNWYNPFAWLLRHSVKQNLEFIADDKVVQNGFDKKEYQYLLLKVMGNKQFAFTNHFNFSNLKKRIAMMNTLKTAKVHLIKFLFLLPVVAVLLLSFRKEIQKAEIQTTQNFVKDTVPNADSGYKISVITTPGGFDNPKMNRTVNERMNVEDWNKNKDFYESLYGKIGDIKITQSKNKDGKIVKFDSVYVTKYKPTPIDPNNAPLVIVDGVVKEGRIDDVLKAIKPEDIQSLTVLKDESATSLYGDKGKNGVIIMRSKESSKGRFKLDDGRDIIMADSVAVHDNGKIEFIGNVSGVIASGKKIGNIDASQNVPKSYNETVVVKGHKIKENPNYKKPSTLSIKGTSEPLIILDGTEITSTEMYNVKPKTIDAIIVLKDKSATTKYGNKGKNGVVEISTKTLAEK